VLQYNICGRSVGSPMQWLRSRSSLGLWLALVALAFQFAASFGHVHGVPGPEHATALLSLSASTGADSSSRGASDETPDHDDGYCAVCALIHLANTMAIAEPPVLALPANFGQIRSKALALEFVGLPAPHAPFLARAPPIL